MPIALKFLESFITSDILFFGILYLSVKHGDEKLQNLSAPLVALSMCGTYISAISLIWSF